MIAAAAGSGASPGAGAQCGAGTTAAAAAPAGNAAEIVIGESMCDCMIMAARHLLLHRILTCAPLPPLVGSKWKCAGTAIAMDAGCHSILTCSGSESHRAAARPLQQSRQLLAASTGLQRLIPTAASIACCQAMCCMHANATARAAVSSTAERRPDHATLHRAVVASVRPFGVFVRPEGHPQDALVHASQVNEQLSFSREDQDADKVKALEFFAPPHSQVQPTSVQKQLMTA